MTRDEALNVLGLQPGATREEVNVVYRELAQMLHPDKFGGNKRLRERAEQQMRRINEARDTLLKGGPSRSRRRSSGASAAPDSPASIAFEATARANAAETARLTVVAQLRTMRERRRSMLAMLGVAALVMAVCSRLRGTVGTLAFSVASMLVVWGAVDSFILTGQIDTLRKRSIELLRARDAARDIARQAREL